MSGAPVRGAGLLCLHVVLCPRPPCDQGKIARQFENHTRPRVGVATGVARHLACVALDLGCRERESRFRVVLVGGRSVVAVVVLRCHQCYRRGAWRVSYGASDVHGGFHSAFTTATAARPRGCALCGLGLVVAVHRELYGFPRGACALVGHWCFLFQYLLLELLLGEKLRWRILQRVYCTARHHHQLRYTPSPLHATTTS